MDLLEDHTSTADDKLHNLPVRNTNLINLIKLDILLRFPLHAFFNIIAFWSTPVEIPVISALEHSFTMFHLLDLHILQQILLF